MGETLNSGERRTRKRHQCYDCCRGIPAGTVARFSTNKTDGRVYTLYSHVDCAAAALDYFSTVGWDNYWDGVPGLRDELCNSGEYHEEVNRMRGAYPHVVARLELTDQLRDARQ